MGRVEGRSGWATYETCVMSERWKIGLYTLMDQFVHHMPVSHSTNP